MFQGNGTETCQIIADGLGKAALDHEDRTPFHFTFTKPITPDTDAIDAPPSPFLVFLRAPSQLYPLAQSTLAEVSRVIRNTTPNSSHCEFHSPKA